MGDRLRNGIEIILAAAVVLGFVIAPFLDRLLFWVLGRNKERFKTLVHQTLRERLQKLAQIESLVDSNIDKIEMLYESSKAQGQAIRDELKRHNETQQQALESMTQAMREIQQEAHHTAQSVSHIYGLMKEQPWDGVERRRKRE